MASDAGYLSMLLSRRLWQENGTIVVLVLFVIFASIASGGVFLRPSNLSTVLYQASIIGVMVLGQAVVVISGAIDLSAVAILLLSAVLMGGMGSERQSMMTLGSLPFIGFGPALALGFVASVVAGFTNGVMVAKLQMPAFIATLATALLMGGVVLLVTGGSPIYYPDPFYMAFGESKVLGLPAPVLLYVGVALAMWWILNRTAFGKSLYAVGGNENAAHASGINVAAVRIAAFSLCGFLAGVAGFMFLSRTGYVSYASAGELLMATIASLVVGGISLSGAKGGVKHAVAGVLLLASLNNFMNIMLISPYVQNAINGMVILISVAAYSRLGASDD